MITMILMDEARGPSMLEIYFSRCYGLTLLTLSTTTMLLTGSIPLTNNISSTISRDDPNDPKTPYAVPTVLVTSCFHAISAFYTYAWYVTTGQVSFALAMVAYGGLASVGLWCLLFGSEGGRISRRTGADKRTSGWPFGNVEADRKRGSKGE
ncbi:hypothetical protein FQN55_002862 [Onygenales sp. PD_40]|nr:hypothetical protein FQN55_002862 [Onygenales sp. PD_40]